MVQLSVPTFVLSWHAGTPASPPCSALWHGASSISVLLRSGPWSVGVLVPFLVSLLLLQHLVLSLLGVQSFLALSLVLFAIMLLRVSRLATRVSTTD